MRNITTKNPMFTALFAEQSMNHKKLYLAPYCTVVECEEGTLLYNALSRELILLDKNELNFLEDLDLSNCKTVDYLKKGWFFIPDTHFGKKYCDQLLNTARLLRIKEDNGLYKSFTIMTTMECNARCFYCFEKGRPQPRMSAKIAKDIASYILTHTKPEKPIKISWFGGEPLYNTEAINIISNALKSANREYISNIVSNGYLINEISLSSIKDFWNVKKFQITLDGTENIYNRSKNFIYTDCESPFKRVIANIKLLLENDIKVAIRLNLGLHNAEDLYKLVDFLGDEFSGYKNLIVYSHRLFDYDEFGNQLHKDDEIAETIRVFNEFNAYLIAKKLNSGKELEKDYKINHCMADSKDAVVITPDGKLTKCEHFSDREIIGDIYSDNLDVKLINDWKELQPETDICNNCPAYMDCLRLKKCPNVSPNCDIHQKAEQIQQLKLKILNTYTKWKEKSDNKKTGV